MHPQRYSGKYDLPLGLTAPVVLVGKQILQEVRHGKGWDEPIDGEVLA